MKALVKVGYSCNEKCTFCHAADTRGFDDTAERIDWKIDRAKRLGYSMVVLSGGEPTLRPELLRWARRVAGHGLDFGLVTNGLLLSYPHVTSELVESCRLRYVYTSLHGGDAKVHRAVVRADTFAQAMAAIEAVHGRVADLTVNCVVTTANAEHLRALVDRLLPFPGLCVKLSMTQPKGAAHRAFDVVVPDVARAAAKVRDAIEYGLGKRGSAGPRFGHEGLPLCLLPGLEHLHDDLKTHRFATMIEADEDDFVPVDEVASIQPEPCLTCGLRGACPGLYRGYFDVHGGGALRPRVDRPRSGSYDFVFERDVARPRGAPCPIEQGGTSPYDRARTLFVRLKDRMRLYRTETRELADVELFATKEELGQVYLEVASERGPGEPAAALRQLALAAECASCARRPACTGAFEPLGADVLGREQARTAAVLASLEGRVLCAGAAPLPYAAALEARAAEGAIEYAAVELDALSAALGDFDHVLALSWERLVDPAAALDAAAQRLRPGGTLTMAGTVAVGLVRREARGSEGAPSAPPRYRNGDAEGAARLCEARGLRVAMRRDVGRGTSNEWLLRCELPRSSSA